MSYHYLLDLALIISQHKAFGVVTQRIQMPQVVGALLAGLILGPACLNILGETAFLTQLSEMGVIVLMFTAGLGTDVQELKRSGKAGFLVALLGVLVPLVMGTCLAWLARADRNDRLWRLLGGCVCGHHPYRHLGEHYGGDPP